VLFQPSCQVGWSAEIEQCISQELQLLQRQRLDLVAQGNGGFSKSPAPSFALDFTFLAAFLPAPIQKITMISSGLRVGNRSNSIVRTISSRSGRGCRIRSVALGISSLGNTGSVSRLLSGSSPGRWPSS
jgi:hypothetical protein